MRDADPDFGFYEDYQDDDFDEAGDDYAGMGFYSAADSQDEDSEYDEDFYDDEDDSDY